MNVLQFFHKKEQAPMFNIGDKVRLRHDPLAILPLYNKEYPNCAMTEDYFINSAWANIVHILGEGVHIVAGIKEGTIAAGGWFVAVDNIPNELYYHGNIFELC
jgi:hypothetical protein